MENLDFEILWVFTIQDLFGGPFLLTHPIPGVWKWGIHGPSQGPWAPFSSQVQRQSRNTTLRQKLHQGLPSAWELEIWVKSYKVVYNSHNYGLW